MSVCTRMVSCLVTAARAAEGAAGCAVTEMYPHDVNAFIKYKVAPLSRRALLEWLSNLEPRGRNTAPREGVPFISVSRRRRGDTSARGRPRSCCCCCCLLLLRHSVHRHVREQRASEIRNERHFDIEGWGGRLRYLVKVHVYLDCWLNFRWESGSMLSTCSGSSRSMEPLQCSAPQ